MLTVMEYTGEPITERTAEPAGAREADRAAEHRAAEHRAADPAEVDHLAWEVERSGLADHEDDIARLVSSIRPTGASSVLVDVLADPTEPECARVRAFGRLALWLGAHPLAT